MSGNVVLVGCGNMGYAMLTGWLSQDKVAAGDVTVVEPDPALNSRAGALGVNAVDEAAALPETADLVIFAVKPQVMSSVIPDYRRFASHATFLSVAAGVRVESLETLLGGEAAIIRCMPNTPAAIGKGMLAIFSNRSVTPEAERFARSLLEANGEVTVLNDEALMDAVTAVSGSGPAYLFHFIECLTEAGEKAGLPAETAAQLAIQTVYGAACLARDSADSPTRLREQVTSPNGTTAAALGVLMENGRLSRLVEEAVKAAKNRSIELGA